MARATTFVLVREGSSDDGLVPHLRTLLVRSGLAEVIGSPRDYVGSVEEKLRAVAAEEADVDIVFVHRDADARSGDARREEIRQAAAAVAELTARVVPVVPIQALEAWLLLEEAPIRRVAGRPSGSVPLDLPPARHVEDRQNPKRLLQQALLVASQTSGRRYDAVARRFGEHRRILLERLDLDGSVAGLSAWSDLVESVAVAAQEVRRKHG